MPSWQRAAAEAPHVSILETQEGLGIYNPAKRSWPLVAFLLVWLCGWGAGELFAIGGLIGAPLAVKLFLGVWLAFWTIGGLTVIAAVLWKIAGSELVFLTADALVREIRLLGFTWRTVVDLDAISAVEAEVRSRPATLQAGTIRYVAGGRARRLGIELNEEDAHRAVNAIRSYIDRRSVRSPESPAGGAS